MHEPDAVRQARLLGNKQFPGQPARYHAPGLYRFQHPMSCTILNFDVVVHKIYYIEVKTFPFYCSSCLNFDIGYNKDFSFEHRNQSLIKKSILVNSDIEIRYQSSRSSISVTYNIEGLRY